MQQTYQTRQRKIVLSFLREHATRCFTAKELKSALLSDGTPLGEATVYRTLDLLLQAGFVKRFEQGAGRAATYQYADDNPACEHHLHFKCRECGTLYHLDCHHLQNFSRHLKDNHGFCVSQADTVLYGICKECGEAL